jgi:Transposase, Mutator family
MPAIKTEVLDELLSGVSSPEDLLGDGGIFRRLKKALMERALGAELTHHLGYEKGAPAPARARSNSRNGHSAKKVLTDGQCRRGTVAECRILEALPPKRPTGATPYKVPCRLHAWRVLRPARCQNVRG